MCDVFGLGAAGAPASSSTTGVVLDPTTSSTGNPNGTTTTTGGPMMLQGASGGGCSCSLVQPKGSDVGWGALGLVGIWWIRRRARAN